MDKTTTIRRVEGVHEVEMGTEIGLLNPEKGNYYLLNEVSADIWRLLSDVKRLEEIINYLMDSYEVTEDKCYNEVVEHLTQLSDEGLIQVC